VHAHVLVMDGVFTAADSGALTFHALPSPRDDELRAMLGTVRRRVLSHLRRYGWLDDSGGDADTIADEEPVLAACYRGSIAKRQTLGPRPGAPLSSLGAERRKGWANDRLGHCRPTSTTSICTRALRSPPTRREAWVDSRSWCATVLVRRSPTTA